MLVLSIHTVGKGASVRSQRLREGSTPSCASPDQEAAQGGQHGGQGHGGKNRNGSPALHIAQPMLVQQDKAATGDGNSDHKGDEAHHR